MERSEVRKSAQIRAYDEYARIAEMRVFDTFTRDEADEKLGYSWPNIADIYPDPDTTIAELMAAISSLNTYGFTVNIGMKGGCTVLQVSVNRDVLKKVEEKLTV